MQYNTIRYDTIEHDTIQYKGTLVQGINLGDFRNGLSFNAWLDNFQRI